MPTPAERKALLFLAGVIVLGASVRVVRAARDDGSDDPSTRQALARQLAAVDSAQTEGEKAGRKRPRGQSAGGRRAPKPNARQLADSSRSQPLVRASAPLAVLRDAPSPIVDLDVATEAEIETLPRIGPVLARRITEDRSANGPFGSLDGFERVRGVGPSLAAALQGRVTFSGTARPSNAVVDHRLRTAAPSSQSARRERRP